MSNYDDWRTETDLDYADRMHVHDRGPAPESYGGVCQCGTDTTRAVSQRHGFIWQCHKCAELAIRSIYDRASRKVAG